MPAVVTAAEMRELDRQTIEELGLPGALLMEHAGRAVADEVLGLTRPGDRVTSVCGTGGNGGDGIVAARWLREAGRDAVVVLVAGRPRAGSDAALHLGVYEKLGGPVVDAAGLGGALTGARAVIDAIFGTGLARPVDGAMAQVIQAVNGAGAAGAVRVAVDIPSGLDADTGAVLGAAVQAEVTVTLAFEKLGLVGAPGFARAGRVVVADIGIPRGLAARLPVRAEKLDDAAVAAMLPARPAEGHKGTFGHAVICAGSRGKAGAALLSARAALRAGAGLVTLAVPPYLKNELEGRVPEVMLDELAGEGHPEAVRSALVALCAGKRALAWGPGMPTSPPAGAALRGALAHLPVPAVLDADALNHLAAEPALAARAPVPLVLTPHPGEAARLLGVDAAAIQADRVGMARRLAMVTRAVVVLKGARTVVAGADGRVAINPTGNPGMGTGGAGDVLTGVIAALLAQGLGAWEAACAGVYVHGRAGDRVAARLGAPRGLIAGDLVDEIPAALASLGA